MIFVFEMMQANISNVFFILIAANWEISQGVDFQSGILLYFSVHMSFNVEGWQK